MSLRIAPLSIEQARVTFSACLGTKLQNDAGFEFPQCRCCTMFENQSFTSWVASSPDSRECVDSCACCGQKAGIFALVGLATLSEARTPASHRRIGGILATVTAGCEDENALAASELREGRCGRLFIFLWWSSIARPSIQPYGAEPLHFTAVT